MLPNATPYVFHKTAEVLPDSDLHTLGNDIFLLCRGNKVSNRLRGQYAIMTYDGSDSSWWAEGLDLSDDAPTEWAYLALPEFLPAGNPAPHPGAGIPEPDMTPFVFHKTAEVTPDPLVHPLRNHVELLCWGGGVSRHDRGEFAVMTFGAYTLEESDRLWHGGPGREPEAWAYLPSWPLAEHPTAHINYAAPNQQLRGHILRPTGD